MNTKERIPKVINVNPHDYYLGQLNMMAAMVKLGAKPAAEFNIRPQWIQEFKEECWKINLHFWIEKIDDNHSTFTIFKEARMAAIRQLISELPNGALRDWCWGKFFGYSDYEILKFVRYQWPGHFVDNNGNPQNKPQK